MRVVKVALQMLQHNRFNRAGLPRYARLPVVLDLRIVDVLLPLVVARRAVSIMDRVAHVLPAAAALVEKLLVVQCPKSVEARRRLLVPVVPDRVIRFLKE